jgi:hypothetical protein
MGFTKEDQLMKSGQHLTAALSALVLLVASIMQARRGMARAREKVKPLDENDLKKYLRRKRWWWPLWLRGRIPEATGEAGRDTKHLIHVARLWELIIFGSATAVGAELFDLWIDRYHGGH